MPPPVRNRTELDAWAWHLTCRARDIARSKRVEKETAARESIKHLTDNYETIPKDVWRLEVHKTFRILDANLTTHFIYALDHRIRSIISNAKMAEEFFQPSYLKCIEIEKRYSALEQEVQALNRKLETSSKEIAVLENECKTLRKEKSERLKARQDVTTILIRMAYADPVAASNAIALGNAPEAAGALAGSWWRAPLARLKARWALVCLSTALKPPPRQGARRPGGGLVVKAPPAAKGQAR